MTRYDGLDGAKRLELLEEIGEALFDWKYSRSGPNQSLFNTLARRLAEDNTRVSRLEQERDSMIPSDDDDSRWRQ